MAQTPSAGCMMAVRASEKACSAAIDAVAAKCGSVVAVAAVNAPESTVLSGDYVAVSLVVAELAARNEARGADASKSKATKVRATHPDHSPRMRPVGDALAAAADAVFAESAAARAAVGADREGDVGTKIHVASSVTGRLASRRELRAGAHWARHATGAVRFTEGLRALAVKGICVFVEFGEGMLVGFGKDTLARGGGPPAEFRWTPSLAAAGGAGDDARAFQAALGDVKDWASPSGGAAAKGQPGFVTPRFAAPTSPTKPHRKPGGARAAPADAAVARARGGPRRVPALAPDAQPPSTTCDGEALAPDAAVLCKIQPPPHALRSDPGSPMTEPHAQTLTVWMPRDALLDNFLAYLEHEYGMRLDVIDALGAGDAHKRGDEPAGPLATDGDFDAALGLAADKAMGAAYFLVRAKLDGAGRPLPPRHAKVEGPFAPDMVEGREKIDEERRAASAAYDAPGGLIPRGFVEERMSAEAVAGDARRAAKAAADAAFWATASDEAKAKRRDADAKRWHDLLPEAGREDLMPGFDDMVDEDTGVLTELIGAYDPKVGRKVFKHGYQCAESEPFPALEDGAAAALEGAAAEAFAARRELLAIIPPPSRLPEHEFPADSMGGRCLDAWRYRWGQRIGDAWLFVPLPPGATVADVDVAFGTFKLGVSLCGVPLYDGPLWNCDETRGVDVDTAAWVVVLHEGQPVLQVELHKKKNYWWKAIWADHPTIEPWEVPFWKDATFNDGYHRITQGDVRQTVF